MKKFKYQRYDYSILYPHVNLPIDYTIKNIEYKDGIVYMTVFAPINEITVQINANDLLNET